MSLRARALKASRLFLLVGSGILLCGWQAAIADNLPVVAPSPTPVMTMTMPMAMPVPSGSAAPSALPTDAPRSGTMKHDMSSMNFNGAGVMSMRGMARSGMRMGGDSDPETMPSITDVADPMTREGSGTSWIPDATHMYAHMFARGDDMEMTHGAAFGGFTHTGSRRGLDRVDAPNWWMYMRSHPTSPGAQIGVRTMLSGDAATVGGAGYPLLFQTGEQWHDRSLHDVQHPHDLIAELALTYSGQVGKMHSAYVYVGYPGEPAIGPPAYMHRALAYDYAPAPLGHHWQDATHITFGVVTAGVASTKMKLESSAFTGREPNQARTNFDPLHLDSYAERFSWNPNRFVAAQISNAFIRSPEASDVNVDVHRTTASLLFERPGETGSWSHAFVFGQNAATSGERTNSFLYETDLHRGRNAFFGRIERVSKSGHDLVVAPPLDARTFWIGAYTAGIVHDLARNSTNSTTGIGASLTLNTKPATLSADYGAGSPLSFQVFFRTRSGTLSGQNTSR